MDRITILSDQGNVVDFLFESDDIAEVNMLRRAMMSEIETYAIDIVIFQTNTSPRHDEVIALRLGQLVIDHSRFVPPEEGDFRTSIDFLSQGPERFNEFTTEHIPDLPFKYLTPIATLRVGQRITCEVIVKRGQAKDHVKWRPVSAVAISDIGDKFTKTLQRIVSSFRSPLPEDKIRLHIDYTGPGELTTANIPQLGLSEIIPIVTLQQGQHLACDVVINWKPTPSTVVSNMKINSYQVTFKNIGMLTSTEIIAKSLEKIPAAVNRSPKTIFSQAVKPHNI
jgi:DNA-directed RNA polymerase alpha subunit